MDRKLYYCESWQHKKVRVYNREFEICVSPKIEGNVNGTSIQFHGIILKGYKVATIERLNRNISIKQRMN
jgi:hypothetical protein